MNNILKPHTFISHLVPGFSLLLFIFLSHCNWTLHTVKGYFVTQTTLGTNLAGYFNGNVERVGLDNFSSDSILKRDIEDIHNASKILARLHPRKFKFNTADFPYMSFPLGEMYGLIAQQVEPILPSIVHNAIHPEQFDTANVSISPRLEYKSLNYEALIPILIQGFREQLSRVDSLQRVVDSLVHHSNHQHSFQHGGNSDTTQTTGSVVYLELNSSSALIYQNIPNPFTDETTINYFIPDNTTNVKVVFYNEYGQMIKETELTDKGNGSIKINSANLANGIYSYSLIINGVVKDTKRMIRSK